MTGKKAGDLLLSSRAAGYWWLDLRVNSCQLASKRSFPGGNGQSCHTNDSQNCISQIGKTSLLNLYSCTIFLSIVFFFLYVTHLLTVIPVLLVAWGGIKLSVLNITTFFLGIKKQVSVVVCVTARMLAHGSFNLSLKGFLSNKTLWTTHSYPF